MSNELRRLISDASHEQMVSVVNRLLDVVNGNDGGRVWLLGDDGIRRNIVGGATLDTGNYPLRVEPGSTNQVNVLHSDGVTVRLRSQDAGVTIPVITGNTRFANNVDVDGTLNADGATTLGSTVVVTGAATFNGAVTLGNAAGDVITVTGTATFTPLATFTGGLTSTGALTANGAVTLGDASSDVITVLGTATFTPLATFTTGIAAGAVPALSGAIRMTNNTFAIARDAGNSADLNLIGLNSADQVLLASSAGTAVIVGSSTSSIRLRGTDLAFFDASPQPKPTVSGSRAGNAALADLLSELATLGLITNSSSA
jgi:hypothetical protein